MGLPSVRLCPPPRPLSSRLAQAVTGGTYARLMADPLLISDEDLVRLLDGRPAEQVAAAVEAAGADGLIRRVLGRLGDRLHLDAGDAGAVMRWDVVGVASTRSFQPRRRTADGCSPTAGPRRGGVAVALAVDDLLRLAAGRLGGRPRRSSPAGSASRVIWCLAQRCCPGFDMSGVRSETALTDPRPDRTSP